jgi:hypothetical protein
MLEVHVTRKGREGSNPSARTREGSSPWEPLRSTQQIPTPVNHLLEIQGFLVAGRT